MHVERGEEKKGEGKGETMMRMRKMSQNMGCMKRGKKREDVKWEKISQSVTTSKQTSLIHIQTQKFSKT